MIRTRSAARGCRSRARPTSTSSSRRSSSYERGEIDAGSVARLPAGARHLRPAPGRGCADAAREDSAGHADAPSSSQALADVGERYSRGFGHITTRQNVQFHFVKLHDVEPAMRRLADAGLTTREACGNSVRNITACPYAGVAADERFDVTPYAEALTRFLLRHPLSSTLPRKFKIAFEGCPADHIAHGDQRPRLPRARRPDGGARLPRHRRRRHGDHVHVGRRCSTSSCRPRRSSASPKPCCACSTALGDYQHKQRNRMKFLIKALGWTRWREEYDRELPRCRLSGRRADARDRSAGERAEAGDGDRDAAASRRHRLACPRGGVERARASSPIVVPVLQAGRRVYAMRRADQRAPAEAVRLSRWPSRHGAARRSDERADARARRAGAGLRRRHQCA